MSNLSSLEDSASLAVAGDELAGHAVLVGPLAPTSGAERINSLDVLRGFSLMGILIVNIPYFALPEFDADFPLTTIKPVFSGSHWKVNTALWFLRWIVAEGKMRALFSILFGAGTILLTSRAESRGLGLRTADIYMRRNMWLVLFGLLHCYLIWDGDILFFYGVIALLFLFPCRNLKARTLIAMGIALLMVDVTAKQSVHLYKLLNAQGEMKQALVAGKEHRDLSETEKEALANWQERLERLRPPTSVMRATIAAHQQGYLATRIANRGSSYALQTTGFFSFVPDILGMMLLGMGLLRNGFLTGAMSSRIYGWTAAIGLGVTWPLVGWGAWFAWRSGFEIVHLEGLLFPYQIGRLGGVLGNAALLLLMVKHGVLRRQLGWMAAVGRMALTNYLMTSLCLQAIFVWSRLHWFGYLDYYEIYGVMIAMWGINIVASTIWLQYFRFGPAEWAWRSLTYWRFQPMRANR